MNEWMNECILKRVVIEVHLPNLGPKREITKD